MGYLFGPVNSRRLGLSLGVDLLPAKICNYDCLYCEVGKTLRLTCDRREYVPTRAVIAELKDYLAEVTSGRLARPDYITITASGEPTLHAGIGEVIRFIKSETDFQVAVLTNGSTFADLQVRLDLLAADLIIPSLDSARLESFVEVNRPAPCCVSLEEMIGGLADFGEEFGGEVWLEVLLVKDVNDGAADLEQLRAAVALIKPDRLQLNTVVRPPAEDRAKPMEQGRLLEIARSFSGTFVEIIAEFPENRFRKEREAAGYEIFEMLQRRPCTHQDICQALGMEPSAVTKIINELSETARIRETIYDGRTYYQSTKR
ncbi:MAG: radical SAM protein [Proteobacteria bacterium]|nr:radical SAM protein [Pseudomonadota bacterium]MBU1689041.1 radical SAM protein [Pseudomonadota bacterium]